MRAALYARFSSDLQNERSIDDQLALCRQHAAREGLTVTTTFEDRARSGASVFGRPGLAQLMEGIAARQFDVVVVEAFDRLSRDQEDLAGIWKRAKFAGVEIRAVHDGKADAIQIGVRGLVGALYLTDLAHKIRRAGAGRVRDGKLPGGLTYGYRADPLRPGIRTIDEGEAATVRRIFAAYAEGAAPRAIAGQLNADGVPAPRGRQWNASTINGSRQRQNGILHNQLYRGVILWNRTQMVKNPESGRRVSRVNAAADRMAADAPHLRIVDEDLWQRVAAEAARRAHTPAAKLRAPRALLSGLLKCGACGASMVRQSPDKSGRPRLRCAAMRESGTCSHRRVYYADKVEAEVLSALTTQLEDPRLLEEYAAAYRDELRAASAGAGRERASLEAREAELKRGIQRLLDAIVAGHLNGEAAGARMREMEGDLASLQQRLGATPPKADVIAIHPAAIAAYRRQMADLSAAHTGPEKDRRQTDDALRELVHSVVIRPTPPRAPLQLEIKGRLAILMKLKPAEIRHLNECEIGGSSGPLWAVSHVSRA